MAENLEKLIQNLGYHFKDRKLLLQALTHSSFGAKNNQRLEFLGDSILGLIISDELYRLHQKSSEGDLSRIRAFLIRSETLAKLARHKQIDKYLRLGPGEDNISEATLADAMEAIIAAIYLDSDLKQCHQCVMSWYQEIIIEDISQLKPVKDAKTQLQEWLQARKRALPDYELIDSRPKYPASFTVVCTVKGLPHRAEGTGNSRRKAEQIAATHYWEQLHERKK